MKAIEWLYDKEFEYVFKNIGKDLWEDLRQEVAVIVLEYNPEKLGELQSKGKQVFKFWIVRICCNQTNSKYGKFGRMYAALVPVEDISMARLPIMEATITSYRFTVAVSLKVEQTITYHVFIQQTNLIKP